jgi:hypothetical protein
MRRFLSSTQFRPELFTNWRTFRPCNYISYITGVVIDIDPGQRCQTQPAAIPSRNPFICTNNLLQITIFSQHMQQQLHQQQPAVLSPSGSLYSRQAFSHKEKTPNPNKCQMAK